MRQTKNSNRLRITEWILQGYFLYTSVLALVLPLSTEIRARTVCVNLLATAVLHGLARWPVGRVSLVLRNVLPMGAVLLCYQQMGWFAQPQTGLELELAWVHWDRLLLDEYALQSAIEVLGPVLPGLLEFLYLLTYAMAPIGVAILTACGRLDRADQYFALYVASGVAAYALFPYFPSEPPRTVFPGELSSNYDTVFRQFNWWILGGAGIHTSVFPSGHVSTAFGCAFGLMYAMPDRRRHGLVMMLAAFGIAVATVYGRYHYAVDALAGIVASVLATVTCICIFRLRTRV